MTEHIYSPGPSTDTVCNAAGEVLTPPPSWELFPPGDAGLTRRVKAAGEFWVVQEKKGRKVFSKGVWAPKATIERIQAELEAERSTDAYAKSKVADKARREKTQSEYVATFFVEVLDYLAFDEKYEDLAQRMAMAITLHATPVGSGTVARTKRISVEQRAEAAIIAWMRHHTTAYDSMKIPREKGKRREVRRMLAKRSKQLLDQYRQGQVTNKACPLQTALQE